MTFWTQLDGKQCSGNAYAYPADLQEKLINDTQHAVLGNMS